MNEESYPLKPGLTTSFPSIIHITKTPPSASHRRLWQNCNNQRWRCYEAVQPGRPYNIEVVPDGPDPNVPPFETLMPSFQTLVIEARKLLDKRPVSREDRCQLYTG